ncbi:MAG: ABC transporter permease [Flavobacteriaceae bacterium]
MTRTGIIVRLAVLALLLAFLAWPDAFSPIFEPLTQRGAPPIYTQANLLQLTLNHLLLVGAAVLAAAIVSIGLAIFVTRPAGAEFLPLSRALANVGQTFPPVAVLALAVPALGFGAAPTFVALFIYGLLPIFENTLTGLSTLPRSVLEAARGMGMTDRQMFLRVELPLALPVILAGMRLSTVIAVGTATIGSTVAASTLGEVIIAGLLSNNLAFILQGGLAVAALAVLLYDTMRWVENAALRRGGGTPRRASPRRPD